MNNHPSARFFMFFVFTCVFTLYLLIRLVFISVLRLSPLTKEVIEASNVSVLVPVSSVFLIICIETLILSVFSLYIFDYLYLNFGLRRLLCNIGSEF